MAINFLPKKNNDRKRQRNFSTIRNSNASATHPSDLKLMDSNTNRRSPEGSSGNVRTGAGAGVTRAQEVVLLLIRKRHP